MQDWQDQDFRRRRDDASPARFTQDEREALFAAVLAHDTIHPRPMLPARLHLDYDSAQLGRCFHLSLELWDTPDRCDGLHRVARAVMRKGSLDDEEKLVFKNIRARYKQLRFAYALFDERHLYPRAFDRVTRIMSHLQDALVLGQRAAAFGYALALDLLLGDIFTKRIARELAGFRPTTTARFQDYIRRDIARCLAPARAGAMTGSQFHAIRKVISRQAALYDCLRVLYPSAYHDQVSRYISTINGLMGAMHDGMVHRKRVEPRSYATEAFPIPEQITAMLLDFSEMHRVAIADTAAHRDSNRSSTQASVSLC